MINSVEDFIGAVNADSRHWSIDQPRWFRGEPNSNTPLVPSLYRQETGGGRENRLLQTFRAKAPAFALSPPDRKKTDEWLFLAQHVGLPTRLLDWSESVLIGLYFALQHPQPVVWMLNPLLLNHRASGSSPDVDPNNLREFPLPWFTPEPPQRNIANENIRGAWENDIPGAELPVAVHPSYVHGRLRAQRACFTVHGKRKEGLCGLIPDDMLKRYQIDPSFRMDMQRVLTVLGVTESVAYPDLDGLARELRERCMGEAV